MYNLLVVFIVFFIFGLVVGSFLNVVIFRLGTGERIGNSRSRCFSCGKILTWRELIPVVSFLIQKGKCRNCGSRISWQYPVVEFVTGVVFFLTGLSIWHVELGIRNYELWNLISILFLFIAWSLLIAISVYDIRHKIIPNQLVYPFILFSFFFPILHSASWRIDFIIQDVISHIFAGITAFAFFASLWFFSRGRWMGFGDAKLALGIGFLLGPWLTTLAVLLSFWIGTFMAVPLVLFWGKGLKTQIPFGPFLAAGAFISWYAGEALLAAYQPFLF